MNVKTDANADRQLPEVQGRPDLANLAAAAALRASLSEEPDQGVHSPLTIPSHPPFLPTASPSASTPRQASVSSSNKRKAPIDIDWSSMHRQRLLQSAYQRYYNPKDMEPTDSERRENDAEEAIRGAALIAHLPSFQPNVTFHPNTEARPHWAPFKAGKSGESKPLGAQGRGEGVVGNVEGQMDCDIPIIPASDDDNSRAEIDYAIHQEGSTEEERYRIGPYVFSLNPDVLTQSKEHPARVWNALMQTLKEDRMPVIETEYVPEMDAEGG